ELQHRYSREGLSSIYFCTDVRIALQLEDGSRLQGSFLCGQTLWDLINYFPHTRQVTLLHFTEFHNNKRANAL
uniref:Uncharacterized protein n=1 Tax=Erpetoichthys calabaricus TaxID=27687 RepID=A0A8C4TCN3_ERPCA